MNADEQTRVYKQRSVNVQLGALRRSIQLPHLARLSTLQIERCEDTKAPGTKGAAVILPGQTRGSTSRLLEAYSYTLGVGGQRQGEGMLCMGAN